MSLLTELSRKLEPLGMTLRGGFHPGSDDGAPESCRTLLLIGNTGSNLWRAFSKKDIPQGPRPLDTWTKAHLDPIAKDIGARAAYYFEGPPYWPVLTWARRGQGLHSSPLGLLLDPKHGLWHAYRAVFMFEEKLALAAASPVEDACQKCAEKPCLTTCPVDAFSTSGYDVPACVEFLRNEKGKGCMSQGCKARRACPVGKTSQYDPPHAAFHMKSFLDARLREI